jgi:hypothetical protein
MQNSAHLFTTFGCSIKAPGHRIRATSNSSRKAPTAHPTDVNTVSTVNVSKGVQSPNKQYCSVGKTIVNVNETIANVTLAIIENIEYGMYSFSNPNVLKNPFRFFFFRLNVSASVISLDLFSRGSLSGENGVMCSGEVDDEISFIGNLLSSSIDL